MGRRLGGPSFLQYRFGVAIDPDIAPDLDDPAIRADQNRSANDSLEGPAVEGFFAPGAVGLEHFVLAIGTVLPPSRGKRNAGALAPATSTDDFPAGGLAAAAFEGAAPADLDGLNRLDGALCEASLTALLLDLTVVARPLLACFVWCFLSVDAVDGARAGLRAGVLGDFLRVFLDMRLPFVAFGGSIIRLLQVSSPHLDSGRRLGKSDSRGVWLEEIRRTTRLLVECASEVQ